MAGRFEGLSDLEWQLFADLFPEPGKRGKGMPHAPFRYLDEMPGAPLSDLWTDLPRINSQALEKTALLGIW
jgi:hypothetical protein